VNINKDKLERIISIEDGQYKIEFQYEANTTDFKSALVRDYSSGIQTNFENISTDSPSVKKQANEFINLVKKSLGKKKSKRVSRKDISTLAQQGSELILSISD
jgi:hypothetical protein